jgi:DNA adenine methylase
VQVMLSNSDTPFINEIYSSFCISRVLASRAINSKSDSRGKISEVLVTNTPPVNDA